MQSEEEYLGGFGSNHLKLAGTILGGYSIYATNRRVIGISLMSSSGAPHEIHFYGSGGMALDAIYRREHPGQWYGVQEQTLTKDEGAKIIAWLDSKKKGFEISKVQVSQIELKKPGLVHQGYLKIALLSGEEVKVWIGYGREFDLTKNLMQAFLPEAVKLID